MAIKPDAQAKAWMTKKSTDAADTHVADRHDLIRVHGARANNLADGDVELPKGSCSSLTVFSCSGYAFLVLATIAAESQMFANDHYLALLHGFLPPLARPDVALLDVLTTAIIVDQERLGSKPRSTV